MDEDPKSEDEVDKDLTTNENTSSAPVLGEMGIVLSLMCATFVFSG
jgi:hypothetical protein